MRRSILGGIFLLILLALVGMFWISYELTRSQNGMRDSDFFSLWAAGRLLGLDIDPYNELEWQQIHDDEGCQWISDPTFLYPLPVALLFVPLGFLSLQKAAVIWLFLSQIMIYLSIYLCCLALKWDRWLFYIPAFLAGTALWRGVIVTLRNGQLGAFLLFCISVAFYSWSRGKWFLGGLFIGFLVLKPPLTGLFLLFVTVWLLVRKREAALWGMVSTVASLSVITWLLQPSWFVSWLGAGFWKLARTPTIFPTLWGLSASLFSNPDLHIMLSVLLSFILITIVLISLKRSDENGSLFVFLLVLPLTLFLAPYMWAYDHILLLLPITVLTAKMDQSGLPFIINSSVILIFDLIALGFILVAGAVGHDVFSSLLPILVICVAGIVVVVENGIIFRLKPTLERIWGFLEFPVVF